MSVKIITGNIGSGKTEYCIDEIEKIQLADKSRKCVMLVPSHYSHETEKTIIDKFGGTGLNNIEVTSFEKLARNLLSGAQKHLSAPGKQSLICRAAELCIRELENRLGDFDIKLIRAVKRPGFLDVAESLISELHRYSVTVNELREQANNTENSTLEQKLEITAMLCENYDGLLSETEYIDSDEDLSRLANVIGNYFNGNTSIWIDKFDEFLPQQFEVVTALIDSGADITVTFNVCDNEEDTYYGTLNAINNITEYSGAKLIHLPGGFSHITDAPDLKFLFSTWFDRSRYTDTVSNAEIFEARDSYTEIEHIACRILDFVRDDKYRFRDISVICGNPESYGHIIEAVFDEYDIPYYNDERFSISEHPIAMQLLALFDIIENNWDYSSMFEYLRAGFVYTKTVQENGKIKYRRIPSDSLDILENYVIKYGIRGKNIWCRSWVKGRKKFIEEALGKDAQIDDNTKKADALREIIVQPIVEYYEDIKTAETVKDYCCAVYRFLENINLYQGLKAELLSMAMNKATADAQRFGQIWNLVLDVLDQLNTALGTQKVSSEEFTAYLRAAMTKCMIRTVPSGVDRVFIGSVEKNSTNSMKIIFMAGAVSGTFPSETALEGFLSNADREYLADKNIQLAPTTSKKSAKLYNSVYRTLSAVSDKLCISYPVQTPDGKPCRPSQTVIDIRSKLSRIKTYDDILISPEEEKQMYISSPKATLHKMLIHPKEHPLWSHVNDWFYEHKEWKNGLFKIKNAKNKYRFRRVELNAKYAGKLFEGQTTYSATRLNTYALCPFRHYVKYGLRAGTQEEWTLNAADAGTYAHEIIRTLCEKVDNDSALDWSTIDDDTLAQLTQEITADTIKRVSQTDITGKERAAHIFSRMSKTVETAVKTVRKSIACGEFRPYAYEKEISVPLTDNIKVFGIIDRLDVCSHDGVNEYRIIDYKTGREEFKVSEIYNGFDMQPVIYALVMRMLDKNAVISGMYYSKVRDDYAKLSTSNKAEKIEKDLKKNTELNGATFLDKDKEGNLTFESMDRIESGLSREEDPLFFIPKRGGGYGMNVRSRKAGEALMGTVLDKIIETDNKIRCGSIDIAPLERSNNSACTYCDFSPVCKFDESLSEPRKIAESDSEVWKMMEGDE